MLRNGGLGRRKLRFFVDLLYEEWLVRCVMEGAMEGERGGLGVGYMSSILEGERGGLGVFPSIYRAGGEGVSP